MVFLNRSAALRVLGIVIILGLSLIPPAFGKTHPKSGEVPIVEQADLETCLNIAMENNRRRPASRYAIEMAEARHRQALAGYWPQIHARGGYQQMDEYPNYIFPSSTVSLPMGGTLPITIPGVGTIPVSSITVPEQDIKLMDKESFRASLEATWLLYDGGLRKGHQEQARGFVEMMNQEARRTDLEITDSVKRLYWGAVLAQTLHQLGQDALARMEATLNLTETMYKQGGGSVKKTDWLDNKTMVESLRAMLALLEKNELMARAALANTMGHLWHTSVKPVDTTIPFEPVAGQLKNLVGNAYRFNPDWARLEAGILAAKGAVRSAKSAHHPKLALTGELFKWWNDYDAGMATDRNEDGWTVGIGVEIPIFSGFLHQNKVAETRARVAKLKEQKLLLQEGIGIQIKDIFLGLMAAEKSSRATGDAATAAEENRDLNTRAYQHGLVDTEKVIRAQLMDSFMAAQHWRSVYDHVALQSRLDLVVGTEVLKILDD